MRTPQTTSLFCLAAFLFILGSISTPPFYPAPIPAYSPDGSPLLKLDGTPVVHRDMAQLYKYMAPGLVCLASSICMFIWWLLRIVRSLTGRSASRQATSNVNVIKGSTPDGSLYPCPCCGARTLGARGASEICDLCFWEDDGQDDHNADDVRGGPNGKLSLTEARRNLKRGRNGVSPKH